MGKRWCIHPLDTAQTAQVQRELGVPPVVAQLLVSRGLSERNTARQFLDASLSQLRDPQDLPGLSDAADRIDAAIKAKRSIVIYGDYDADGMTSSAILINCLRLLGAQVSSYVPNRLEDGYGLNQAAIEKLADQGASLVITVDCGITSCHEAEVAAKADLELIITDHHKPAASLPKAAAIVHPQLPGHNYPFAGLCGAGVAFKLAWAVCQRAAGSHKVSDRMRAYLLEALGLAAIGTVADVVPLIDENRPLVRHGLVSLKQRPSLGLAKLMEVAGVSDNQQLSAEDIAFSLAPRLNAAGRLGQAALAVELLTTSSEERAQALAEYIHRLNDDRVSLERSVYVKARKQAQDEIEASDELALVLAGRAWHEGVIGIVAGQLAEKLERPVVVLSQDKLGVKPAVGSARSVPGIDLHAALTDCTELLVSHGGHAAAAGLKVEENQIDAFRAAFCEAIAQQTRQAKPERLLAIDAEAPLSQLTQATVDSLEMLAPFGEGNRRPLLCTTGVSLQGEAKTMGRGDRHMSATFQQHGVALRAVAFGRSEWVAELAETEGPLDIAYRPVINAWRGRRNVELHLVDWRKSTLGEAPPTLAKANQATV